VKQRGRRREVALHRPLVVPDVPGTESRIL